MSQDEPENGSVLSKAKTTVEVLAAVVKVAGDSEDVRAAGKELGKTALTVTKLINNALLPLAAFNYGVDKAKRYFEERFPGEMAEKIKNVPQDQLKEPKASMAAPVLQGLGFAHEDPALKDMYLGLLACAMDKRRVTQAHPAYAEIIRQLSPEEVVALTTVLTGKVAFPIVNIQLVDKRTGGGTYLYRHLVDARDSHDMSKRIEDSQMPAHIENWIRLGLIEVSYIRWFTDDAHYKPFDDRPELIRARSQESESQKINVEKGMLERTHFGKQFAEAVSMFDQKAIEVSATSKEIS